MLQNPTNKAMNTFASHCTPTCPAKHLVSCITPTTLAATAPSTTTEREMHRHLNCPSSLVYQGNGGCRFLSPVRPLLHYFFVCVAICAFFVGLPFTASDCCNSAVFICLPILLNFVKLVTILLFSPFSTYDPLFRWSTNYGHLLSRIELWQIWMHGAPMSFEMLQCVAFM